MNHYGRDQRDYIRFRESDSFDRNENETDGSFTQDRAQRRPPLGRNPGVNRFGEEHIRHDSFQDDDVSMKPPYEHGGPLNRWSDDIRSEASRENHRGKGPKGYSRSSERIFEEACEILTRNHELDASNIEVIIQGDILVLEGEVSSRHDKRLAESLVEDIPGIHDVHNHLLICNKDIEGWIPGIRNVKDDERGSDGKAK